MSGECGVLPGGENEDPKRNLGLYFYLVIPADLDLLAIESSFNLPSAIAHMPSVRSHHSAWR